MKRSGGQTRWLWPWLHAAGVLLTIGYVVLWHVEPYTYAFSVYVGGMLMAGSFVVLLLDRLVRRRRPLLDRPALVLLVVLVVVHTVAVAMIHTINWC